MKKLSSLFILLLLVGCAAKAPAVAQPVAEVKNYREAPEIILVGDPLNDRAIMQIVQEVDKTCAKNGQKGLGTVLINHIAVLGKAELAYVCLIENKNDGK